MTNRITRKRELKESHSSLKQIMVWFMTLIFAASMSGCYMDVGPATQNFGLGSGSVSSASTASSTHVHNSDVKGKTGLMALVLYVYLVALGVDGDSAALVALAFYSVTNLELLPTTNSDHPLEIAPYMAKAAIVALSDPSCQVPAGITREQLVEAIVAGLFKGLGENTGYGLTSDEQLTLLETFVGSATSGIGESTSLSDKNAALIAVAGAMVSSLSLTGVAQDKFVALSEGLMKGLSANVIGAGINGAAAIETALSAAVRTAVAKLSASGVTDQTILDQMMTGFSDGSIGALKDLGLTSAEQASISAKIAEGVAQGMVDSGYSTTQIESMKTKLDTQISSTLTANGVDSGSISAAQSSATSKLNDIISGLTR